jgi:hypothetical protein
MPNVLCYENEKKEKRKLEVVMQKECTTVVEEETIRTGAVRNNLN